MAGLLHFLSGIAAFGDTELNTVTVGHVQKRVLLGWTGHSMHTGCVPAVASAPEMVDKSAFTVTKVR